MNATNLFSKYKHLEQEYTVLLNKYLAIEKMLKRYNLEPNDLLSDEKIHQLINKHKSNDVYWLMDLTGKSTYVSSSIINFTGYNEIEYLAQTLEERFTSESAQKGKNALQVHGSEFKNRIDKNPETSFSIELEYKCKDGSTKWGELTITPVFDENGNFHQINGVTKDISENIRTKVKLFEQEQQFTNLLENLPNYIFIRSDNKIIYANKKGREALGVFSTKTEIDSTIDIFSKIAEKDRSLTAEMIRKRQNNEIVEDYEIDVLDKDEKIHHVIVRATNVIFNGTDSVLFIISDITDRVIYEKTIIESEEKFRTLAELSPYGIMIIQDDKWVYTNPYTTILTEYTNEELSKMHFLDYIHPDYYEFAKENAAKRTNNKDYAREHEAKIITKSGKEKWVHTIGQLINYNDKKATLLSVTDITNKKTEEETK